MFTRYGMIVFMLLTLICTLMFIICEQRVKYSKLSHKVSLSERRILGQKETIRMLTLMSKYLYLKENSVYVDVTAYSPRIQETDSDPLIAASLKKVRSGTIAVSRDLFRSGWTFGKSVHLEGIGIFEINDLMNKRFTKRIDIFMWSTNGAIGFGKKNTMATLLTHI